MLELGTAFGGTFSPSERFGLEVMVSGQAF